MMKGFGLKKMKKKGPKVAPVAFDTAEDDAIDKAANAKERVNLQLETFANEKHRKKEEQAHQAVLEEDPTAFDYDDVYDQMKAPPKPEVAVLGADHEQLGIANATPREGHKVKAKPKYIRKLLEKAEEKKREWDLVMERKMQKEREEDEHLHGNQPKYVTKGYKDHLKESNKWKAIEEARAAREAKEDVRKTGDLHGFYRNLLNNNVAFGGEDLGTSSHELSEDAKARVLEKLTAGGRNVDVADVVDIVNSVKNHTVVVEDNGAPVQAEWSKKLQDEHAPIEMPEAEDEEEEEEKEEAPDPEIARLKAELAAAKAKSLREKELKREASEKPETKDEPDSKRARTEDPPAEKKAEKPKEPEVDLNARRNTETAAMDAKARYLARKKQKEDAAKGR